MGSCAAPSAKGDDKFITTDYLQQCPTMRKRRQRVREALPELVALGWTVTEFAAGKYDITRPKAAG